MQNPGLGPPEAAVAPPAPGHMASGPLAPSLQAGDGALGAGRGGLSYIRVQGREERSDGRSPQGQVTKALALRKRKDFYSFAFHWGETSGSLDFMQETSGSK